MNREYHRLSAADWYEQNREEKIAKQKAWYQENRERILAQKRNKHRSKKNIIQTAAEVFPEEFSLQIKKILNLIV